MSSPTALAAASSPPRGPAYLLLRMPGKNFKFPPISPGSLEPLAPENLPRIWSSVSFQLGGIVCRFHSAPAELRLVKNILGVQQMQSRNSSKPDKGPWPLRTYWFPVMGILSPALASGRGWVGGVWMQGHSCRVSITEPRGVLAGLSPLLQLCLQALWASRPACSLKAKVGSSVFSKTFRDIISELHGLFLRMSRNNLGFMLRN